jgi:ornithine cyclodeaminase
VFNGNKKGRTSLDQITIFDSVGFAIEDFSALMYLHDRIVDTDFAQDLDILALPDDPKDLFGLIL